MVSHDLHQTVFPNANFINEILPWLDDHESKQLLPGEKVLFEKLKTESGVECIESTVIEKPKEGDLSDIDEYDTLVQMKLKLTMKISRR